MTDERLRDSLAAHVEAVGHPFAAAIVRGGLDAYVDEFGSGPPVGQARALEALNAGDLLVLRRRKTAPLEALADPDPAA